LALGPDGYLDDLVLISVAVNGLASDGGYLIKTNGDRILHYSASPEVKSFFKYLNSLNLEGLIDPESPIMSAEMLKQKAVAEKVWSFFGPGWEINSEIIAYEASIGSLVQSVKTYPTANSSIKTGTYAPYAVNLYNTGVAMTTSAKNQDRFFQFYEFANTEEGWLTLSGIVNKDFTGENTIEATKDYDIIIRRDKIFDGKPAIEWSAWMGDTWGLDENWWWNRGLERYYFFTYGMDYIHPNSQYAIPPSDSSAWWDDNTKRVNLALGMSGLDYGPIHASMGVDVSSFAGLVIEPTEPEYTQLLAIRKLHETQLPRIIMASSSQAFNTEWENYVSMLDKAGLNSVMAKYDTLYQARMDAWNSAD
jgi:ABC-type glycerol-3-phosphate transport system substrate-binding protein